MARRGENTVMLGFMATDKDVGYYNAAVRIKTILVSIVTSLGTVLLPRASYYIEHRKNGEFKRITKKTLNFVFLIATPMTLYFIYFAKEGICFLSGKAYMCSIIPMRIIMPTLLLIGISNVLGIQILVPMGREKTVLYSVMTGALVNVILNALLIPQYASTGAAIGTVAAEFAVSVFQYVALKDEIVDYFKEIHYGKIFVGLILGSIASLWIKSLGWGEFLSLLLSALLFFGVYGLFMLIAKEQLIVEAINQILDKIFKKVGKKNV